MRDERTPYTRRELDQQVNARKLQRIVQVMVEDEPSQPASEVFEALPYFTDEDTAFLKGLNIRG